MLRRLLRDIFVNDALLKAVSLVLSVVLFLVVRGDKDAAAGAYAKVIYVLPPDRVLVSDPQSDVRLGVRGPWTRVSRLDERDIEAIRVDLTRAPNGDFAFTEDMIKLPTGLRLASITPPSVKLKFEPRVSREVPVQPILEGEPLRGFRVERSEASPRTVRIVGAKSVVEGVQRARTRPLRVTDARAPVKDDVALEPAPPHAQWDGVSTVTVAAEVVPVLAEKRVAALPVRVTGAERLEATVEPETADVVLRGPEEALAQVTPGMPSLIVDAAADDARPPGASRKRISVVNLPPGVAAEVRPESVTLVTRRRRD